MHMLKQLVNNKRTDKNTTHSYLDVYEPLLSRISETAKNILEIVPNSGGGLDLFHKYFKNAMAYGIEYDGYTSDVDDLKSSDRVCMYHNVDAYTPQCIQLLKNVQFDFILDDGPHSLKSQLYVIQNYSHLLTEKGILVIEDIQNPEEASMLLQTVPETLRKAAYVVDRRAEKGRFDDILLIIDKNLL